MFYRQKFFLRSFVSTNEKVGAPDHYLQIQKTSACPIQLENYSKKYVN